METRTEHSMISREDALAYGLSFPNTYRDAPFHDDNWQLVRVEGSKKAFLWTYERNGYVNLNVKADPQWRDFWRSTFASVVPGWHQNKEHWNTIILDGTIPDADIRRMIAESYDLVTDSPSRRIYEAVKKIPEGKVATYGQVAELAGDKKMARAVGNALHKNPDPEGIPCYRVVNAKGELAGEFAFGGAGEQAKRLEAEGVEVVDGRVDLQRFGLGMSNITEITDFSAAELDIYARMTENQLLNRHEPEQGLFIAESPKVIERALDAGCIPVSFLVEKRHLESQARDLIERCKEVPVYTAEFDVLTQLTGFQLTRGMLCAMRRPKLRTVEEVCEGAHRIAVLEDVVNPTNVGAIFRSAAALNIDAVLLTSACSNPLYRRAIRVSMGTVFQIPWTFLDERGIGVLRGLGFCTAAMALSDEALCIDDERLCSEPKLAIILGTEGDGLSAETIAASDYTVCIPMSHGVDSLNVAAASAVAFWQLSRRTPQT